MNMKIFGTAVLCGATLSLAFPGHADTSFNLSTVSLYKSRGVDQDGRNQAVRPALQGGVDYAHTSGLYLGNWNSSGRFGNADVEIDLYGGWRMQPTENLGLDVGYIQYYYPGEGSWNQGETYAGASYRGFGLKIYRGMRPNVNEGDLYYLATYSYPILPSLRLDLGLGYQTYHATDLRAKTDYSVGLSYSLRKHFTVSGTVAGADRRSDVEDGSRNARFILGLGASF